MTDADRIVAVIQALSLRVLGQTIEGVDLSGSALEGATLQRDLDVALLGACEAISARVAALEADVASVREALALLASEALNG